jgi:hypothetical protein
VIDSRQAFTMSVSLWFSQIPPPTDPFLRAALAHRRATFDKKMATPKAGADLDAWLEACLALTARFDALLVAAPPPAEFPELQIERRVPGPRETNFLVNAIQRAVLPTDLLVVTQILAKDAAAIPVDQAELTVDLKDLEAATILKLYDYLYERFPDTPVESPLEPTPAQAPKKTTGGAAE